MAKRQVRVKIMPDGEIKINNAGNPNEKQILDELAELAALATGDKKAFVIEKHEHTHGGHGQTHQHVGGKS